LIVHNQQIQITNVWNNKPYKRLQHQIISGTKNCFWAVQGEFLGARDTFVHHHPKIFVLCMHGAYKKCLARAHVDATSSAELKSGLKLAMSTRGLHLA
jgi:hypothetical protein